MGGCRGVGEGDDDGGEEQQYSLRWSDFHASLASSFRRLRDDEDFVDVTLACDGRSFTAHKVVLSACSPYFRRLLKANPCQHPIVILRDVKQRDLEALLRFMYNGEVQIGQDQLSGFLATAQMLEVRGLAEVPSNSKEHHSYGHHHTPPHSRGPPQARANATSTPNSVPWGESGSGSGERRDDNHVSQHHGRGSHHHNTRRHHDGTLSSPPPKRSRPDSPGSTPAPASSSAENHPSSEHGGRDSLLGQALEGSTPLNSHHYQGGASSGEESSSEDESEHNADGGDGNTSAMDTPLPPPTKREPVDYHDDLPHNRGVSPALSSVDLMNTSGLDLPRTPTFPGSLLHGLPGLLPGPSGLHNSSQDVNYVSSRRAGSGGGGSGGGAGSLDMMRVRATDPRPCPKCGKIYRSAHTLRTHLEDKHTVCPGYRCVLCGTVAKSRNSLHSHMSRQHRGISTKDLPVLPMPAPFDPELASRLLAKAGVKVSPAELAARASPTGGPRRSDLRLDLKSVGGPGGRSDERHDGGRGRDMGEDMHTPHHRSHHHHQHRGGSSSRHSEGAGSGSVCGGDDPEDLSVPNSRYGSEMGPSPPPGTAPSQYRGLPHGANGPRGANGKTRSIDSIAQSLVGAQAQAAAAAAAAAAADSGGAGASTGSAIIDTYLQLIAENYSGLALNRADAIAAAKAAQNMPIPGEEEMEGEDYGEEEEEDEEEEEEEEASDDGEETSMAGGEGKSRDDDGGGEREGGEREGETSGGEYSEEEEGEEDEGGQEGQTAESGGNLSGDPGMRMEDSANEMGGNGEGSGGIVEGVE